MRKKTKADAVDSGNTVTEFIHISSLIANIGCMLHNDGFMQSRSDARSTLTH